MFDTWAPHSNRVISCIELSTSVDMQFLQMYGRGRLNVSLLKVQQQRSSIDCGIFAIAFCTEFCYTGRKGIVQAEFDIVKMRGHLVNCFDIHYTPKVNSQSENLILHKYSGTTFDKFCCHTEPYH